MISPGVAPSHRSTMPDGSLHTPCPLVARSVHVTRTMSPTRSAATPPTASASTSSSRRRAPPSVPPPPCAAAANARRGARIARATSARTAIAGRRPSVNIFGRRRTVTVRFWRSSLLRDIRLCSRQTRACRRRGVGAQWSMNTIIWYANGCGWRSRAGLKSRKDVAERGFEEIGNRANVDGQTHQRRQWASDFRCAFPIPAPRSTADF